MLFVVIFDISSIVVHSANFALSLQNDVITGSRSFKLHNLVNMQFITRKNLENIAFVRNDAHRLHSHYFSDDATNTTALFLTLLCCN